MSRKGWEIFPPINNWGGRSGSDRNIPHLAPHIESNNPRKFSPVGAVKQFDNLVQSDHG